MKHWPIASLIVLLAQAGWQTAQAQPEEIPPGYSLVRTTAAAGVYFIEGGISLDERDQLRAQEQDYNVKLEFADRNGGYRVDVGLVVENAANRARLIELADTGPIVMLKLPPGAYRLTAAADGQARSEKVSISNNHRTSLLFHW